MSIHPAPTSAEMRVSAEIIVDQIISTRISPCPMTIPTDQLVEAIRAATVIFTTEPAVLTLSGEHCVVGDIHGNIDALIRIFEKFGYPPERNYLFLGDYIDRGLYSCEVILLLYSLKILYPNHVRMIRGNHEFAYMAEAYGFRDECEIRLSSFAYSAILASFDELPIAAIIGPNFCVHGGISPRMQTRQDLLQIRKFPRNNDFRQTLVGDLVWSDPSNDVSEFKESPRGCGVLYGKDAVENFTRECTGITRIIRAHESCAFGYNWPFADGKVLTVFSSCDYCDTNNDAGVVLVDPETDRTECLKMSPLSRNDMSRRRVTFPLWVIESSEQMKSPHGIDLFDPGATLITI
jgi:diadenosine tetraphosphatase ApaH/serine/threonine PP2A family protein phosphatase